MFAFADDAALARSVIAATAIPGGFPIARWRACPHGLE
jgi:hypothetical protein